MKRLLRALAAATGGVEGPGRLSAGFTAAKSFSAMQTGIAAVVDRAGERGHQYQIPASVETDVASGWYPQAIPPPSHFAGPLAEGCSGREAVVAPQHPPNESNAWSLAERRGRENSHPMQPSLAWEATVGAAIRESSGASGGEVRQRDKPSNTQFVPRSNNVCGSRGVGLVAFAPSAAAVHDDSPWRRRDTSSARVVRQGSPRGNRSPDRWSSYSGKKAQAYSFCSDET